MTFIIIIPIAVRSVKNCGNLEDVASLQVHPHFTRLYAYTRRPRSQEAITRRA